MKYTKTINSIFVFLIAMLSLYSCNENVQEQVINVKPVKYIEVGHSTGSKIHSFPGVVKAEHETKLSFKVGGTLNTVAIELGDRVKKGQLIASIDPIDYIIQTDQAKSQKKGLEANVQSAQANVKSNESQLINSRANFERMEKLYENNSIAISEFQKAKASLASAKAQHDASKAQLRSAETQVTTANKQVLAAGNQANYTKLYAPMDGIITNLMVESNEGVAAGSPIALLSSDGNPEIQVGIPEVLINNFAKGNKVTVELPSIPNETFQGEIEKVAFASGNSPTYPVIVSISNSNLIRPGMAANVTFQLDSKPSNSKSIVIPAASVGEDANGNFVFLIEENNSITKVKKRPVTVGKLSTEGFEVIKGLSVGQKIAVAGLQTLLEGQEVRLK